MNNQRTFPASPILISAEFWFSPGLDHFEKCGDAETLHSSDVTCVNAVNYMHIQTLLVYKKMFELPCMIREEGSTYQPVIALPFHHYIDNRRTAGDFSDKSISIRISHSVISKHALILCAINFLPVLNYGVRISFSFEIKCVYFP